MPRKQKRILSVEKLTEAGMKIDCHDSEDEPREILRNVQHAGAANLAERFLILHTYCDRKIK